MSKLKKSHALYFKMMNSLIFKEYHETYKKFMQILRKSQNEILHMVGSQF